MTAMLYKVLSDAFPIQLNDGPAIHILNCGSQSELCGFEPADIYETAVQEYNNRRDIVLLEMEKWQGDLSNLEKQVPIIIKIASSLSSMWVSAPLELKRKIQN